MRIEADLALPAGYRCQDVLRFHGRDLQAVSERVTANTLQKALFFQERMALLTLRFSERHVHYALQCETAPPHISPTAVDDWIRHLLGLTQAGEAFEQQYAHHPVIGRMVSAQAGLRVAVSVSPYEALTWAIIGQQVSLHAAITMRRSLMVLAQRRHASGLYAMPPPAQLAQMPVAHFRQAGLSRRKAATLIEVGTQVAAGRLPLDDWLQPEIPYQTIANRLATLQGVGPWTIQYTLVRGYGWLDASLHGDAVVRRALRTLLSVADLSEKETEQWLRPFSPWRALLAAHLWAWQASASLSAPTA